MRKPDAKVVARIVADYRDARSVQAALERILPSIAAAASEVRQALAAGGKVLVCGNGGSAADAQHFTAELLGRFEKDRRALPAIAISTDTSSLTAIGNDLGFDRVFSRQVEGLGRRGDLLVAISTSGKSPNVLEAAKAARRRGLRVVALTGEAASPLARLAAVAIRAPSKRTARIQECHEFAIHAICGVVEASVRG
ncbi:MAG: SIS domain-containing protein [Planctomycetota bacterium]